MIYEDKIFPNVLIILYLCIFQTYFLIYLHTKLVLDLPQWTFCSSVHHVPLAHPSSISSYYVQCSVSHQYVLSNPLSVSPPLQSKGGRADVSQPGVGLHQVLLLLPHRRLHFAGDGHWGAATVSPFFFKKNLHAHSVFLFVEALVDTWT